MKKWILFAWVALFALLLAFLPAGAEEAGSPLKVENGMMQPILNWSNLRDEQYTNENSDILRFCVWVETDRDTDLDGKADLVKVLMQVPRPAAEGKYKAATIYDPTPYGAGTVDEYESDVSPLYTEEPFDYSRLEAPCQKRDKAEEISTLDAAAQADPMQWNYTVPKSGAVGYDYAQSYDYFLVRGFAVAEASGIGTYGSEGFELCGTKLERDSHKAVVEWLAGDRRAFADREASREIRADWSNGNVAMTGCSYGGTLPFEVAVTGVKGLKTIIPFAGIASWYDYTNSQGVPILNDVNYADSLAAYNCGGTFLDAEWNDPNPVYGSWLWQIAQDQDQTNGDYAPIWETMDYTTEAENHISCSALVVTGLNDWNVTTRHADLMIRAFHKAGQTVKLVLHQDGHNILSSRLVNGRVWEEIENEWLSHYLYGVENGAESCPAVLAQSNVDGEYRAYENWEAAYREINASYDTDSVTVTSSGLAAYTQDFQMNFDGNLTLEEKENFYRRMKAPLSAVYRLDLPAGSTICGVPKVSADLTSEQTDLDGLMITAVLLDVSDRGTFPAYRLHNESMPLVNTVATGKEYDMGGGLGVYPVTDLERENVPAQCVSFGWTDLQNPECGFVSSEYVYQDTGLETGVAKTYTFFLQPTVYTLAEGHHLELILMTWDPYRVFLDESFDLDASMKSDLADYNYSYTVDNRTLKVMLPLAK